MKFVHFCDVFSETNEESGTRWESERSDEKKNTFIHVLNEAVERGADFAFISGGLFRGEPVTEELKNINDIFGMYPSVKFIITAGANDRITKHSPVVSFEWNENVKYITQKEPVSLVFEKEKTEVIALSVSEEETDVSTMKPESSMPVKVAVCYDESEENLMKAFFDRRFSYVAAGGKNRSKQFEDINCCYAGSLDSKGIGDNGIHGIFFGEIKESGEKNIEFIPVSAVSYVSLKAEVTPDTTNEELIRILKNEIEGRGRKNIYRIKLSGMRNPELERDLSELEKSYRIMDIDDETEPKYDFQKLFSEHPQDMIGFYIGAIKRRKTEMSALEKKAMYYGIEALLKTADKE